MEKNVKEIWKDVKGYEGLYQVSNLGRIKRLERDRKYFRGGYSSYKEDFMCPSKDGKGYLFLKLTKNKVRKSFKVHRLVAIHFLKNDLKLNQVNHIDYDKENNFSGNLEWVNSYENQSHKNNRRVDRSCNLIGVHYRKNLNKPYISVIVVKGVNIHLGCFDTKFEAHNAYLRALKKYGLKNKYSTLKSQAEAQH